MNHSFNIYLKHIFGHLKTYKVRTPNFFMRIMKSVDKKVGDVIYYKYKVNLPKKIIEENKLEDKEFNVKFDKGNIILEAEKD